MENIFQSLPEDERRIGEEYLSSLTDLNCNSKPLINMLTMLAEENINYAQVIVRVVEYHINQVPPEFKLPILYLIDSIIKNVKNGYVQLFGQCIVDIFLNAFISVQHSQSQLLDKVRERMYALRQTWNEVFPPSKMYALDVKVKRLDNNWPITAKQPQAAPKIHVNPAIHVNPNFLKTGGMVPMPVTSTLPSDMEEILQTKTRELLELKKRKLEIELEQTKKHLEEQERHLSQATDALVPTATLPGPSSNALRPPAGVESTRGGQYNAGGGGMRNVRPLAPTGAMQQPFVGQLGGVKPKVHPVNAALLNSVRQRDPRLARQLPQSTQMLQPAAPLRQDPRLDSKSKSSRSRSKSPSRSSGSRSGKSSGSSIRKRSESKSSTASSSSSGSERRKGGSTSSPTKRASDKESQERYARNGSPTSSSKRKSNSPGTSPSAKTKRNVAMKPRSGKSGSQTRSRSRSPIAIKDVDMRSLRQESKSPEPSTDSIMIEPIQIQPSVDASTNDLEKREGHGRPSQAAPPTPTLIEASSKDVDLRVARSNTASNSSSSCSSSIEIAKSVSASVSVMPATPPPPPAFPKAATATVTAISSTATTANSNDKDKEKDNDNDLDNDNDTTATASSVNTSSTSSKLPTKVSFRIQKPFNKLEKSTAHLSTALSLATTTTATTTTSSNNNKQSSPPSSSQGNVSEALKQSISKLLQSANAHASGEKRSAAVIAEEQTEEQPQQKRSKSAKLDPLFGSEDVDLRREMPAVSAKSAGAIIVVEDDSMENWDNPKQKPAPKKATLEELRAKLAKTVRNNNKMAKIEKLAKDPAQRLKQLAELKMNEDSQDAHDEKVRTILTQAQEMYDNNDMSQEQYKDLVHKMLTINESSKLEKAKKREAASNEETELPHEQRERNAARDAVLKKRIPKLKGNENQQQNQRSESSPRSEDSPRYEEPPMTTAMTTADDRAANQKSAKPKRDSKRRKPSKWGEQVDPATAQRAAWLANNAMPGNNNKRGGFRAGAPNNMRQAMPPSGPWQQPFSGVPSMLVAASAPTGATLPSVGLEVAAGFSSGNQNVPPQQPGMMAMAGVQQPPLTKAINSLDNPMADVVRSITIDGGSKEIRFYNQVAIIFMDGDEPHEIGFQQAQRAIFIDNNEPLPLCFNDDYKPFTLDGQLHRIRFGFPSRELYIDEHWYEIYFGGPPVSLPIGNAMHVLKAEGPPPNVDIGRVRRDLVVGKINMIVDAQNIVPLFLDAKLQTFQLGAESHQLQFVDGFMYVLLDGQLHKVEYGGLPKSVNLKGRKCFIRFGTLPKGVLSGKTHVKDMEYYKTEPPAEPPMPPPHIQHVAAQPPPSNAAADPSSLAAAATLSNLNIDELFQKLVSSGIIGGSTAAVSQPAQPAEAEPPKKNVSKSVAASASNAAPAAKPTKAAAPEPAAPPAEPIKRIDLNKMDTIKTRQSGVVATLYLGMQCSSCGVRFPPEQTIKYSQHLDWHFRQNRRERDSTRKATSRRWYYDLNDWMQYEEIEDVEERDKNFLEAQQQGGSGQGPDVLDDLSNQRSLDAPSLPSCAAGADDVDRACDMCHEQFEQFYNEECEEWHLRNAIRVEEKIYHPLCYDDYKASLNPPPVKTATETESTSGVDLNNTDDNAMDTLIKMEGSAEQEQPTSNHLDDDDDDVIVLPNEEPSVTEIVDDDDDEYVPANVTREEMGTENATPDKEETEAQPAKRPLNESAAESDVDVEIQEPNIPFTDLDNYVEKELPEMDEAAFLSVKIKEEPKDDEEDEDDGFEDVGTVHLLPPPEDEISINSSETQTQTIGSSASPATLERPPSVASLTLHSNEDELELEQPHEATSVVESNANASSSIDGNGNGDAQETHNLSAAGLAPALPLASIVNKIKINITKNTSSNSNNSASNANNNNNGATATTTTTIAGAATMGEETRVSAISVIGGSENLGQVNAIQTISTIPVFCGGNHFVPKITSSSSSSSSTSAAPSNISSISVIGSSYGSSSSSNSSRFGKSSTATTTTTSSAAATTMTAASSAEAAPAKSKTPEPEPEPEPVVELKPALKNITLKKTKKVQSGVETSGLCSIM